MEIETPDRPIWLQHLELTNFRCFEHFEIDFPAHAVVLAGPNGSGKTSLLNGIWGVLANLTLGITGRGAEVPLDFMRLTSQRSGGRVIFHRHSPASAAGTVAGTDEFADLLGSRWGLDATALWIRQPRGGVHERDILPILRFVASPRPVDPISTSKALQSELADKPTRAAAYDRMHLYSPARTTARLAQLALEQVENNVVDEQVTLDALAHAMWPDFRRLIYSAAEREGALIREDGSAVLLGSLSAGQWAILSIGLDLAFRAHQMNGHLGADVLRKTPGIVVVDELDEHLHPGIAQRALPMLMSAFPLVQFIVASHSPQVWSSAPNGTLIALNQMGEQYTSRVIDYSDGADASFLLESVFSVEERPPETRLAKSLASYRKALLDSERSHSDVVWAELDPLLGPDDPERVRLEGARKLAEFHRRAS